MDSHSDPPAVVDPDEVVWEYREDLAVTPPPPPIVDVIPPGGWQGPLTIAEQNQPLFMHNFVTPPPLTPAQVLQLAQDKINRRIAWDAKRAGRVTEIVDTRERLLELLHDLQACGGQPPEFVVDCEGFNDYRLECDVIEIYHISADRLYLVDIWGLTGDAFFWTSEDNFSLCYFLQSNDHLKLMYDCRQDANALKMSYDITLRGVADLSLMVTELQQRTVYAGTDHRVAVGDAIRTLLFDKNLICEFEYQALLDAKAARASMFETEVWARRPLDPRLIEYAQDVRLMGDLYSRSLAVMYTGTTRKAQAWQEVLHQSAADAAWASTSLLTRDGCHSIHTPWTPGYFVDPLADHSDWMAEREAAFQSKIAARRMRGHTIRPYSPPPRPVEPTHGDPGDAQAQDHPNHQISW